jgi:hypothetical protein
LPTDVTRSARRRSIIGMTELLVSIVADCRSSQAMNSVQCQVSCHSSLRIACLICRRPIVRALFDPSGEIPEIQGWFPRTLPVLKPCIVRLSKNSIHPNRTDRPALDDGIGSHRTAPPCRSPDDKIGLGPLERASGFPAALGGARSLSPSRTPLSPPWDDHPL